MLKQIDRSFALGRNSGVDAQRMLIDAKIRVSRSVDKCNKETKINEFNKRYKFYFPMDRRSLLAEYIRSTGMKKGSTSVHVNPWYDLVELKLRSTNTRLNYVRV
jgi:hypothetical protein